MKIEQQEMPTVGVKLTTTIYSTNSFIFYYAFPYAQLDSPQLWLFALFLD